MKKLNLLVALFGFLASASLSVTSAQAQTWVSAAGSDSSPCTRTYPCQSFTAALAQTPAGGVIACIDNGAVGSVIISKAVTIDCEGAYTSVSNITVNAGANDKITLRGLALNGVGVVSTGINFNSGSELNVENVSFNNFTTAGILVNKTAFGILTVRNSTFTKMPTGIKLQTTVGNIVASISDSKFNGMSLHGVEVNARSYAAVTFSVFSTHNGSAMIASTSTSTIYAKNNTITNCGTGINAATVGAKITASGNGIYGNSKAFNAVAGATFLSANNNEIDINPGNPPTGTLTSR